MRFFMTVVILYCASFGAVSAFSLDFVDKLDIKAIKSIHLTQINNEFRATIKVQFGSTSDVDLKFKNANFKITFKNNKDSDIYLGVTESAEFFFPASEHGIERLQDENLNVYVGKNDLDTLNRLIEMFNLMGNPNSEFAMILSGVTDVGTKVKRGWIYQGHIEIEDFTFHPTIQREVLFK